MLLPLLVIGVLVASGSELGAPSSSLKAGKHFLSVRKEGLTDHTVMLDGRPLLRDQVSQFVTLIGSYEGNSRSYVLIHEDPGGNACGGQYKAIDLTSQPFWISPAFGNCSDQAQATVVGGVLHIGMPAFTPGGMNKTATPGRDFTFGYGRLTEIRGASPTPAAPVQHLTVLVPNGKVHLYYKGPNDLGPTILDPNVSQVLAWPPVFRTLKDDTIRGVRLGMNTEQANDIARATPMQPDENGNTKGATLWYQGLGPRAPAVMGMPNIARLDCSAAAVDELGLRNSFKRQLYRTCFSLHPKPDEPTKIGWISSVQSVDPNTTSGSILAALEAKYGPASVQPASNEMIWFIKDAEGAVIAIDALFSDIDAYKNPDTRSEGLSETNRPKLLDVEAKFFALPAAPTSAACRIG